MTAILLLPDLPTTECVALWYCMVQARWGLRMPHFEPLLEAWLQQTSKCVTRAELACVVVCPAEGVCVRAVAAESRTPPSSFVFPDVRLSASTTANAGKAYRSGRQVLGWVLLGGVASVRPPHSGWGVKE